MYLHLFIFIFIYLSIYSSIYPLASRCQGTSDKLSLQVKTSIYISIYPTASVTLQHKSVLPEKLPVCASKFIIYLSNAISYLIITLQPKSAALSVIYLSLICQTNYHSVITRSTYMYTFINMYYPLYRTCWNTPPRAPPTSQPWLSPSGSSRPSSTSTIYSTGKLHCHSP